MISLSPWEWVTERFIEKQFGLIAPLFQEIAFDKEVPILDLHEALSDWERNITEARAYVAQVIEHIWESMPALMARLPRIQGTPRSFKP
ncbi:MAG: hypothetical protein A4E19_21155 [Nitrospira sp. SG-bin1]|nr:MAG: hypothetical protein A4E19_21155 [Nitrospira sp. SG-bin1]